MSAPTSSASETRVTLRVCLAVFGVFLLYLFGSGYQALYYDSNTYWELSGQFYFEFKRFHLLSYHNSLRGYLLPLLLFPLKVGSVVTGIAPLQWCRLLGAALAAVLFGWAVPALWQQVLLSGRLSWRRRPAFAGLGFLFWRDYFNFPLSDFPAFLSLVVACWLMLRWPRYLGAMLLCGSLCMAAANFRPIYLSSAAFLFAAHVWLNRHALAQAVFWKSIAAFALGVLLIGGPQLAINLRHWHKATPLVLATRNPAHPTGLYLAQLTWGLAVQKFEGTIDPTAADPRIMYTDPVGQRILDSEHLSFEQGIPSPGHYAQAMWRNLPEAATLYGRHVFNGLDLKYATPYIKQLSGPTLPLSVLNYTVLFLALLVLWHNRRRWVAIRFWLVAGILLAPVALAIPTAIECRFFIPLHVACYAVLCFAWPRNWQALLWRWPVALSYLAFVAVCLMLSANTLLHASSGPRLLWP